MKEYLQIIKDSSLFMGMDEEEMVSVLECLAAETERFKKGDFIFHAGDRVQAIGLVLKGNVLIVKDDFWGNRNILAGIVPGQFFAEAYACLLEEPLDVSVLASQECEVMFLDLSRMTAVCHNACRFHIRLVQNLLWELSKKNLMLTRKIEHTSKRSIREKVLSYLSEQSRKAGSPYFEIPFNRQQLADYLSVDRSAMSGELGRLREEGILEFEKNRFRLKETLPGGTSTARRKYAPI